MLQNYEQLVEKIAKVSGLDKEEINQKVEAKCAKLSGLISKEGSAQIVASELGVSFENEKMKIAELLGGMNRVNVVGKLIDVLPVREFTTKSGIKGKVLSATLADDSGNIRAVLWDTNHIKLFEEGKIKHGDVVDISNAGIRNEELHLGSFSDISLSKELIGEVVEAKKVLEKKIVDLKPGINVKLRGILVQMFEPKFFEVCPECSKKAIEGKCDVHGVIAPQKRALIAITIDDGSENMKGVVFSDQISKLGINQKELDDPALFAKKKAELVGEEFYFICNVRTNNLFNTTELIVNGVEKIDLDSLIKSLR